MMLSLALACTALFAAADVREIHKTVSLAPNGRVSIDTYKGLVKVTTWDQPRVEIHVRIETDSWSLGDREQVRDTEIEIDSTPDSLRLKTRYPKRGSSAWFENVNLPLAKYTIQMPRTAQLRIKDYKSEITVDGLAAGLDIDTYKGEVRVFKQGGGAVSVKTYKSDARVEFANLNDRTSFETYRGSYDLTVPRDARFDLDSNVGRHGSVRTSIATERPAGRNSATFRSRVNGGGPAMSLKGYRGEFSLR